MVHFRYWHEADLSVRSDDVRSSGQTGLSASGSPLPSLTKATLAATRDHPLYDMDEEADYQHEMEERDAEHDA